MNTKKVTITITQEQQENARAFSKEIFGKNNISGFIGYLIEKYEKEQKENKKNN